MVHYSQPYNYLTDSALEDSHHQMTNVSITPPLVPYCLRINHCQFSYDQQNTSKVNSGLSTQANIRSKIVQIQGEDLQSLYSLTINLPPSQPNASLEAQVVTPTETFSGSIRTDLFEPQTLQLYNKEKTNRLELNLIINWISKSPPSGPEEKQIE